MAKYVVEFSPPEKIKSKPNNVTDSVFNYCMMLAPFQKQTQIEFTNIKLKEIAIRFLTVVNPHDKPGQFVLPPPSDGIHFNLYKFTLEPNSQCELAITWQPFEYGNMRKLIKIEQVDFNRKYDFVILGNCSGSPHKKFKGTNSTDSKSKNSKLIKNHKNGNQKNITLNKTINISCETEKMPLIGNLEKTQQSICEEETLLLPMRRQTYLVREKENLPVTKKNICRDTILTSPEHNIKRPDQKCQDEYFNNHFNIRNLSKSFSTMNDDSLEKPFKIIVNNCTQINDFNLSPLQSTENLVSTFSTKKQSDKFDGQLSFDFTDGLLSSSSPNSLQFKLKDSLNDAMTYSPEKNELTQIPMTCCNQFMKTSKNELNTANSSFGSDTINSKSLLSFPEVEEFPTSTQYHDWTSTHTPHHYTSTTWNNTKQKRPSFTIKNSYYKNSPKSSMIYENTIKPCSTSLQTTHLKVLKLDKYDQYLKCLTNSELLYHYNVEDPFLKMSEFYETEWLNRQESDMIRWINTLLTPSDKLVDEEQSGDLEQAAIAWIEASKTSYENKPMQFATQKDLFVAQIYRQSPQQWNALRKATTNLIMSKNVVSVLSKLTVLIEKDLITVRDDRQIHLDLSLKKKVIDLLKCYNPLWLRIGLEAIYGQIVYIKPGSNDLDGVGWFIRKNLFNNDFVKQKFTKTTVLQINLPSYNIAMKKFILRKIFMLIYFLDCAKEQQLIRHKPCLFKIDSSYKSSYDLLMGFCADMVAAHGDIIRRLRSIGYILNHKQTHLDEVNYAVKNLNDLRDGIRITRIVEILFKGSLLSSKLRLPAISKLQKVYNVNLALNRISKHISIEGNISARDIVNGHREKILSLFWQIIYKFLTPRYNNAATKIQNWWRSNSLKLVILKRIRLKEIAKRHLAATKIQAHVRGFLIRKQWPCIKIDLINNRQMLHAASNKIKFYLKDKLNLLTNERKHFIILRRTVVLVQRKYRTKMAMVNGRRMYLKIKQSAVIIQKVFRGFILRKNWPQIQEMLITEKSIQIAAVNTIKRALRKNLPLTRDCHKYLKLKQSVIFIQRLIIANRLMKLQKEHYATLKITTVFVQQKLRAKFAMQKDRINYLKIKKSIVLIQKTFRGFIVRKNWLNLQNHLISEKNKRVDAINTIKRVLRLNLPVTVDRLNFLKLKHTVLYVERLYLANKSMCKQLKYYSTLKSTAMFIQRKCRANISMKREQNNYLKVKQSALLIQKTFRGCLVRKRWPETKNIIMSEKKKRMYAINIVKQALRRNLPGTQDQANFLKLKKVVLFIQQKWRANKLMKIQKEWYITFQNAAVFIQRKFRANIAMHKEHENYLKAKKSVLIIQKIFRGFIVKKNWPTLKITLITDQTKRVHAANLIKQFLRKNLSPTQDQLYYEQLRHLIVTIQRRFRASIMMKAQRNKFQILKSSAIILQRRFLAIQAMKTKRKLYVELRACTIQLQSAIRGYLVRKKWPILRVQLQIIQINLIQNANIIKRALRKGLPPTKDRVWFLKLQDATIVVQRAYRTRLQAQKYQKVRAAVISIQHKFRANAAMMRQRKEYQKIRAAVIILQTYIRGYLIRKQWHDTKCILLARQHQLIVAINIIKKFLRQCLPDSSERSKYLLLKQTTVMVQTRYRAIVATKLARAKFLRLRQSAIILQQRYRARQTERAAVVLQSHVRGLLTRRRWPVLKERLQTDRKLAIDTLREKIKATCKIQAFVRGFLTRKRLPKLKNRIQSEKEAHASTLIQALWRGYCVRKKYQCRRETILLPVKGTLTLGKRHNDVLDMLNKQKKNEYSYKELSTIFWNLDTCTSLSKELCVKTAEGVIIDHIFHFLQYSNQSQPSVAAREPAIRVFNNLLRYHETSWLIWTRVVNAGMVTELIKIMKSSCGKSGTTKKLYCLIATWIWIALQDPRKKQYIKSVSIAIMHFKFMLDTLNRKYNTQKVDKKNMALPSTRPTWFIGSKCQKCFESDLFATSQICKILKIAK